MNYRMQYLQEVRNKSRGLIGYFSNYIPQEIIAADGFHPVRIIGSFRPLQSHQRKLFNPVCSFVQDVYAAASADRFSFLDSVIFPNSCDSLKLLYQIWNEDIRNPSAYSLRHPVCAHDSAVHYFAEQIRIFADDMKNRSGVDFTDADLSETIMHYNRIRRLLRQVYKIRKKSTGFLTGAQTIALVTAGMIMEQGRYAAFLEQLVKQAPPHSSSQSDRPLKHILVIGPVMDNIPLLEQIEQRGICIIDDDLTNGSRYIGLDVQLQGDLYYNLAERYLKSAPSPTLYTEPNAESKAFQRRMEKLKPGGVLFVIQKFCEPHIHNYLAKSELLRQMNIPVQRLEIEHDAEQMNERQIMQIESLIEITPCHSEHPERHSEHSGCHSERSKDNI